MDLRKRLDRLDRLTRKSTVGEPARPESTLLDAGSRRRLLTGSLGLQPRTTPAGTLWSRVAAREEVARPPAAVPDLAGILPAGTPADLTWDEILFLDTETTGLAGGTGTLPFLVGLAWWEGAIYRVHQLFLAGPGEEEPLLDALTELANRFRVVATYNGAAFDLPLLRTRARLARREDPCADLVGWDLLVATRRLWGRQLSDCRQQTLEQHLTGSDRGVGDIDGAFIPATYLGFVRDGEVGLLPEVLRHNRRDLDGMARIMAAIAAQSAVAAAGWCGRWQEAWSLALVNERRRCTLAAASWAALLVTHPGRSEFTLPVILDAIRLLKRVAAWTQVESLVQHGLAHWPRDQRLHYEAAVLYEHRLGDPRRALVHATVLGAPRRIQRLERRVARH